MTLKARLADLESAENVYDLLAGSPTEILINGMSAYALSIDSDQRIIFISNHTSIPLNHESQINWNKVNRIKIIKIGK